MEHLWSPWRYDYMASVGATPASCPFCVDADTSLDKDRLIVYRGTHNFIILNLYPYTLGHFMVVPYPHTAKLDDAHPEQMAEMMVLAQRGIGTLRELYRPDGFNLGMNLGHCAGAGIREHFHLHVVPRWIGDANFMTITGETRMLSEELSVTYRRFVAAF
jgi:ATP adenylyltransferase